MVKFARNKEKNNGRNKCKCQFFQGVGACFAPQNTLGSCRSGADRHCLCRVYVWLGRHKGGACRALYALRAGYAGGRHFVNDYFDFMKGTDDETRLGPKRACAQGWITAAAMRRGLLITTLLACAVGLPLIAYGGWEMILVGLACVVFCFLYTISFSYLGLGDVLVLVFFGLVPVCMTYWLVAPPTPLTSIPVPVIVLSLACGLEIDTLLVVNNYRDIDNDRRAGKKTLIVRIGPVWGRLLYFFLGFLAGGLVVYGASRMTQSWNLWQQVLIIIFYLFHYNTFLAMRRINKGAALNRVLGMTARNMMIFGIFVALCLLV